MVTGILVTTTLFGVSGCASSNAELPLYCGYGGYHECVNG